MTIAGTVTVAGMAARAFPGIGFDPAPGDVAALETQVRCLRLDAARLDEAERLLETAGRAYGQWTGEAAERFGQRIGDLPQRAKRAGQAYSAVARALAQFAAVVDGLQSEARLVEQDALEARRRLEAVRGRLDAAEQAHPFRTLHDLEAARDELNRALVRARWIAERYEASASRVVAAIEASGELAPRIPGLLASLQGAVTDVARSAWNAFDRFVTRAAPAITLIADYCGAGAALLGLAALFSSLPVLVIGGVLGGVALLGHLSLAATGNGGWTDVALDAAGLASLGIGVRLAASSASAREAAHKARAALHAARRVESLARATGPRVTRTAATIRKETFAAMVGAEQQALIRDAALTQQKLVDATFNSGQLASFAKSFPEKGPIYRRGTEQLRQLVGAGLQAFAGLETRPA
jgi:uncharacterized protein YukE